MDNTPNPASAPTRASAPAPGDLVRVAIAGQGRIEGTYEVRAGMVFVIARQRAPGALIAPTHGPFAGPEIERMQVLQRAAAIQAARRERTLGERIDVGRPGSRAAYRLALDTLALACRAAADAPGGFRRRLQIEAQFDALADEISLARTKRAYLLANAGEPLDLSPAEWIASPLEAGRMRRPLPHDFDPDPAARRRRLADLDRLRLETELLGRRRTLGGPPAERLFTTTDGALLNAALRRVNRGHGHIRTGRTHDRITVTLPDGTALALLRERDRAGNLQLVGARLLPDGS